MKNVDVPMWDKGDNTDNFTKGGSRTPSFDFNPSEERESLVKEIYKLVLGREPSSKEISHYRYSITKKEDIIKKLLESDEHKDNKKKVKDYPKLKEENKKNKSTILKLRSNIEDSQNEFLELRRLIEEKNRTLEELRKQKSAPYLDEDKLHQEENEQSRRLQERKTKRPEKTNIFDRLYYLIWGRDK